MRKQPNERPADYERPAPPPAPPVGYAITSKSLRNIAEAKQESFLKKVLSGMVEEAKVGATGYNVYGCFMTIEVHQALLERGFKVHPADNWGNYKVEW